MPFKSEAQRNYLYANKPEVARRFQSETPKNVDLPKKVPQHAKSTSRKANAMRRVAEEGRI